jgi:hypothetical protein
MDANLDKVAKDLYGKIQTRFRNIKMGDENANVLSKKEDIPQARFFEFEYDEDGTPLGNVAITLDSTDGIVVQLSGDLVDDRSNLSGSSAYKFIRSFRQFAKDRLLNFDVQTIGKSNLDKRDYEFQAKRKEEPVMPAIMENKLYGNARMSYQDLGEARLVIKHTQPVNIDLPAGRTMHIESIYIENAQGERFKYPYKHLNGARALAEHIKHGGTPYDVIGKHISSLSEELASLRKFKGYVSRQEQLSEAMANVTGRVLDRIEEIKETINKLQRPAYYESFVESFQEQEETMIPEEIQNDLIDRLTVRTFNEELKAVFPYIYKFVDESELPVVDLSADDLLDEVFDGDKEEGTTHKGGKVTKTDSGIKHEKRYPDSFDNVDDSDDHKGAEKYAAGPKKHHFKRATAESQFESFMDDIVNENKNELLSPNKNAKQAAITKVNDIIGQNIKVGPEGVNAILTLKGLIDEPEFVNTLKNSPPETELNSLIKGWAESNYPDLLTQLQLGDDSQAEPAAAEVPPAPADASAEVAPEVPDPATAEIPPAPVAEGTDDVPFDGPYKKAGDDKDQFGNKIKQKNLAKHLAKKGMAKAIEKAKKAGATLETQLDLGSRTMTIAEMIEGCGMAPRDFGFEQPGEQGLPAMLKYISGFYNKDDGNFPLGGMRVKIKVKKAFEDGEFGESDPADLLKVIKFIDMKDPSGNEHNQIMKLAGVKQDQGVGESPGMFDVSALETQLQGMQLKFGESVELASDEFASMMALSKRLQGQ